MPFLLERARRVVVKVGTGVLTRGVGQLDPERLAVVARQVASLHRAGLEVSVVSSGAIGLGMGRLKLTRRPTDLATLQACAAIGQPVLMENWERALEPHGLPVAQLLLIHDDVRHRQRHVNLRNTTERLHALAQDAGVLPQARHQLV